MAHMIRAVDGSVAAGIHVITFNAGEKTFVPDVPEVLEACRIAGAALVEDEPEGAAEAAGTQTKAGKTAAAKAQ